MLYPAGWLACPHVTQCYVIWTFAENQEGAKRFLVDMIDNFGAAFQASGFCNFPCFPKTVPDVLDKLSKDPKAEPRGKYKAFETPCIGPGIWATRVTRRLQRTKSFALRCCRECLPRWPKASRAPKTLPPQRSNK